MSGIPFETANQIVQDAAYELGLIVSDIADVFGSTDQNIVQLRQLLTRVGRDLVKEREWTHLQKPHTITTSNGDYTYDLPADFDRLVDQTGWNRSNRWPLGPIDGQAWQYIQANAVSVINVLFRTVNNEIWLSPTPTGAQTLAMEYISNYWVQQSGQSAGNATRSTAYTDTILFDSTLVMHGLKRAFLRAKGFDTAAVEDDYQRRLAAVCGSDGAAPILSISGPSGPRMIDSRNIPDTGYGS